MSKKNRTHPARRTAFTLVELLVVVMIVGILAAVAVPHFGSAAEDAKIAALDQDLATVRNAIELYRYQHGEYPGSLICDHRIAVAAAAKSFSAADADAKRDSFLRQMMHYSNADGETCESKSSSYPFGPYLRQGLPANPLPHEAAASAARSVTVVSSSSSIGADKKPLTGWKYNCETGEFIANHADYDER
jgi:general secretion pathway protein G